ncbi:MAG: YoaK family protein [Tardiphaga sp.]
MLKSPGNIALACGLSAIAGFVDGVGFIHLGGLFVSFMSGNSTRLGVSVAEADWPKALHALMLIALFVVGAGAGSLIVLARGRHRQPLLLLAEAALLAAGALSYEAGWPGWAIAAIVLAMGLENAVFQIGGGAGLGLTYVTGALVKVGQTLAAALTGGPRWAWLPNLLLWFALVVGSVAGSVAYYRINLAAIWLAAAATIAMSGIFALRARMSPHLTAHI